MAKLLSSLPIGAAVKFGKHVVGSETAQPIVWVVADKNHSGYPNNSVTLITKQIIDLLAYDGNEANNPNNDDGFPNYAVSNINQWLNSSGSAGKWYTAAHSYDTPPNDNNVEYNVGYQSKAGFLYNFTNDERNIILPTTIAVQGNSLALSDITVKVFLPSLLEVGSSNPNPDGTSKLLYFQDVNPTCTLTSQAFNNTSAPTKPSSITEKWHYWTRNRVLSYNQVYHISTGGGAARTEANTGNLGVRPMVNLSSNAEVSDITDSDGCYTLSVTNAPSTPSNVQIVTSPIYATKPCSVKWDASTDPNGDSITYKVHLYYDGVESGSAIDMGVARSYTLTSVKSGVTTIGFGIEAVDTRGHSSGITSITGTVITNSIPTISGSNSDLGNKSVGFSQTYSVNDTDKNTLTVTEYIDNVKIRSYVATLGATNTFAITGETWLKLANGIHTLKITATDGIDEATRTFTFTKVVSTLVVQRSTAIASATKPTRLVVTVVKSIPPEAKLKVEACNNGFDTSPTWEDITSSVVNGQAHVFSNTASTSGKWGVNIRVTVDRNGGEGACYISEIGGNFE